MMSQKVRVPDYRLNISSHVVLRSWHHVLGRQTELLQDLVA